MNLDEMVQEWKVFSWKKKLKGETNLFCDNAIVDLLKLIFIIQKFCNGFAGSKWIRLEIIGYDNLKCAYFLVVLSSPIFVDSAFCTGCRC